MATPRKLWRTSAWLRPATHIYVNLYVFSYIAVAGSRATGIIAKHTKVDMIWVAGRSPTLVSHSEAWRSHES